MRNSVADRGNAQSACAGQFIGNHIEVFEIYLNSIMIQEYLNNGGKWIHIDMAGPSENGQRATGYGVGLLFEMVCELCKKQ